MTEPREPVLLRDLLPAVTAQAAGRACAEPPSRQQHAATTGYCRDCFAGAQWHPTERGRWVLLDPATHPAFKVPVGRRWRLDGQGTAQLFSRANPADRCRVVHWDICTAKPAPDDPYLLALWRGHIPRPDP